MFASTDLRFSYRDGASFQYPDVALRDGEHLLIIGPSGSGKSTLLNLYAGLQSPQTGTIRLNQTDYSTLKGTELDSFRSKEIGIVLQESVFIPSISVQQNLLLTQHFGGLQNKTEAQTLLDSLQIGNKANQSPYSLSIGEQQRLSIARALVNEPRLLLADEPTSALDDKNCDRVIDLLIGLAEKRNCHLIIVTHDQRLKDKFSNHLELTYDE